ncbi:uncharacterized protein V2V93DRAFT_362592, partial [Kockiozyma suomiensis]|uniref:uncharacterized protein n=1 Tax=Kockiozyma suomiensis TaxID=1337062 RepID=UPI0033430BD9
MATPNRSEYYEQKRQELLRIFEAQSFEELAPSQGRFRFTPTQGRLYRAAQDSAEIMEAELEGHAMQYSSATASDTLGLADNSNDIEVFESLPRLTLEQPFAHMLESLACVDPTNSQLLAADHYSPDFYDSYFGTFNQLYPHFKNAFDNEALKNSATFDFDLSRYVDSEVRGIVNNEEYAFSIPEVVEANRVDPEEPTGVFPGFAEFDSMYIGDVTQLERENAHRRKYAYPDIRDDQLPAVEYPRVLHLNQNIHVAPYLRIATNSHYCVLRQSSPVVQVKINRSRSQSLSPGGESSSSSGSPQSSIVSVRESRHKFALVCGTRKFFVPHNYDLARLFAYKSWARVVDVEDQLMRMAGLMHEIVCPWEYWQFHARTEEFASDREYQKVAAHVRHLCRGYRVQLKSFDITDEDIAHINDKTPVDRDIIEDILEHVWCGAPGVIEVILSPLKVLVGSAKDDQVARKPNPFFFFREHFQLPMKNYFNPTFTGSIGTLLSVLAGVMWSKAKATGQSRLFEAITAEETMLHEMLNPGYKFCKRTAPENGKVSSKKAISKVEKTISKKRASPKRVQNSD